MAFFPSKYDIFYMAENERWYFSKKALKLMFSVYSVKMILLFLANKKFCFYQKRKDDLLLENTPKDVIFVINEKDDTYPRKDDIGILG